MVKKTHTQLIYPLHIRFLNKCLKMYINSYWTLVDLFASKFAVIKQKIYKNTIADEYKKEHEYLKIKPDDKILHIGCGMFPFSAIQLSNKKHASTVAIDKNRQYILHAKTIIKQQGLEEMVTVDIGNGTSYNLKPFSVIIISSCVDSIPRVLDNIINNAKPKTRVILRELRPMSHYLKKYITHNTHLRLEQEFSQFSFPFYSILGWDSFILNVKD